MVADFNLCQSGGPCLPPPGWKNWWGVMRIQGLVPGSPLLPHPPPPRHPLALLGWVYLISFLSVNWVSLSLLRGEIRWASITK